MKPTPLHLSVFTELLVLAVVLYQFFGSQLASFGVPVVVVNVLGAAYLFIRFVLPQLPASFQLNPAEADLQTQLEALASGLTTLQSSHGDLSKTVSALAQSIPQNTQAPTATSSTAPQGGTA